MANLVYQEASAATAVGTILTEQNGLDIVPYMRLIKRVAVTGSAAAGDAAIDLILGQTFIGTFKNTSTGTAPVDAKDFKPVGWYCEPNEKIIVKISDASGTNVMRVEIETAP